MSSPLARGLIIAASILVAAGIAILENDDIRKWLDERRRAIAMTLYNIGDGINPTEENREGNEKEGEGSAEREKRRDEIVQRNRMALIRKAQEDGVAVDLDELAAVGLEEELREKGALPSSLAAEPPSYRERNTSFDSMVGADGKLRMDAAAAKEMSEKEKPVAASSSLDAAPAEGLRNRGLFGFASGAAFATPFSNPFDDDANIVRDADLPEPPPLPPKEKHEQQLVDVDPQPIAESSNSTTTRGPISIPVTSDSTFTDISDRTPQYKSDAELDAEIEEAIRRSLASSDPLEEATSPPLVDISATTTPSTTTLHPPSSSTASPPSLDGSLYEPASPPTEHQSLTAPHANLAEALSADQDSDAQDPAFYSTSSSWHSTQYEPSSVTAAGESEVAHAPASSTHDGNAFAKLQLRGGDAFDSDSDEDGASTPSGVLTPTEDGYSIVADDSVSVAADTISLPDVGDAHSEADTADSFSVVGAGTPASWTDVDSESETEAENGRAGRR